MAHIIQTPNFLARVFLLMFLSVQFQTYMVQPRSLEPHKEQFEHHAFVKSYLKAYGYLIDHKDDDVESGVRKFQEFYNLNISGQLDHETIKAMERSRCGMSDHVSSTNIFNNSKYVILPNNPTWPPSKRSLTYSFDPYGLNGDVSLTELRQAFLLVFGQWTGVTKFTFNEIVTGKTDIMIGLYSLNNGGGAPFDGPGGVNAYGTPPTEGIVHFDADENWTDVQRPTPADQLDLVSVALHEIGHILGLAHSNDPNAVMYAFFNPGETKRLLTSDDIAGIHALYPN